MIIWDFQVGRSPAALSLVEPGKLCATIGRPFPAALRRPTAERGASSSRPSSPVPMQRETREALVGKCPRKDSERDGMGKGTGRNRMPQPQEEGEREWKWPDKKQSTIVSDRGSSGSKDINGKLFEQMLNQRMKYKIMSFNTRASLLKCNSFELLRSKSRRNRLTYFCGRGGNTVLNSKMKSSSEGGPQTRLFEQEAEATMRIG